MITVRNKVPQRGYRSLRIGRWSEDSRPYLVTCITRGRARIFSELGHARTVVRELMHSDATGNTSSLAYVIMPDHLHWLFELTGRRTLSETIAAFKGRSSRRLGLAGFPGPIWQSGFHDHAVRHDESLRGISRYIVANPLRAGLVKEIGDYPHWDAVWLTGVPLRKPV